MAHIGLQQQSSKSATALRCTSMPCINTSMPCIKHRLRSRCAVRSGHSRVGSVDHCAQRCACLADVENCGTRCVSNSTTNRAHQGSKGIARERTTGCLVEVHVDAFELQVRVAVVCARWVDSVLIAHDLPEFGTNLVAALAALDVDDLTHGEGCAVEGENGSGPAPYTLCHVSVSSSPMCMQFV